MPLPPSKPEASTQTVAQFPDVVTPHRRDMYRAMSELSLSISGDSVLSTRDGDGEFRFQHDGSNPCPGSPRRATRMPMCGITERNSFPPNRGKRTPQNSLFESKYVISPSSYRNAKSLDSLFHEEDMSAPPIPTSTTDTLVSTHRLDEVDPVRWVVEENCDKYIELNIEHVSSYRYSAPKKKSMPKNTSGSKGPPTLPMRRMSNHGSNHSTLTRKMAIAA